MSEVFRVRVAPAFQDQFASLLPLVQAASLVSVSPADVARLCLERGIAALGAELSAFPAPGDSPVRSSVKKQSGVPLPQGRAPSTHADPGLAPDPAPLGADPAPALASTDAVPLVGTATGPKRESLELVHGTRIREIAKQYPRLGITGSGKLSWPGFANVLQEEHGISNPATGKAFSHGAVKKVVMGKG